MSPLAQILGVRALLSPEGAWRPGYSFGAEDAGGRSCIVRSPEAVRFGVLAGLCRLRGPVDERLRAQDLICRAAGTKSLAAWENDAALTQAGVLAALDRAADLAREDDWR